MAGGILVLAEYRDSELETITQQLLGKGRQLADKLGVPLGAIILGSGIGTIGEKVTSSGVDTVLMADSSGLAPYNAEAFTKVLAEIVADVQPLLFLMGYTLLGMEVGPSLATRLGIPLISNCVEIELSPEGLPVLTRPMYSETVHVRIKGSFPLVVSVQKGALHNVPLSAREPMRVSVNVTIDQNSLRTRILDVLTPAAGGVDITKSDVIVAVGRGIGQRSNLKLATELARALGGVVAASRPIIDMGWLPPEHLVGLSGKTVSPKVYIACGISGAAQHVAGMSDSAMIMAINKDPKAPIFKVAQYGIVGDLFEIVPALIDAAGKLQAGANT